MTAGVIAIDAGQTAMKVRVQTPLAHEDLVFHGIDTADPLLPQLAAVVRTALTITHATPATVAAGISGLTARDADAPGLLALLSDTAVTQSILAHDSITSFLGALGDRQGAVVAAGTGVVTLAVGRTSTARVDGWGHIMGDAGSGYWIGREALDAVMRAYDGRGPATALTAAVRDTWPDLSQAYMALQADDARVRVVAALAADVARLTETGDAVAADITVRAAHELAASVTTAITRVRIDGTEDFAVCALGGVFRSEALRHAFADRLRHAAAPQAELVTARGEGIDGVIALAGLAPSHPLSTAVHRAGTA